MEPAFRRRTTNTAAAPSTTAAPPARAIEVVAEDEPVAARLPFVAGVADADPCGVWPLPPGFVVLAGLGLASSVLPGLL